MVSHVPAWKSLGTNLSFCWTICSWSDLLIPLQTFLAQAMSHSQQEILRDKTWATFLKCPHADRLLTITLLWVLLILMQDEETRQKQRNLSNANDCPTGQLRFIFASEMQQWLYACMKMPSVQPSLSWYTLIAWLNQVRSPFTIPCQPMAAV